jgi:dienelactone hydrolase
MKKGILIVIAALLASLGMNAMLMARFHWPARLWKEQKEKKVALPKIAISTNYNIPSIPPKLRLPEAIADGKQLREWQEAGRAKLAELLGVSMTTEAPAVRVAGREQVGSVTRETLVITQKDGVEVPAFLLLPKSDEARPALIVIPGHSQGIVATAGIVEDYQHAMALRLAEAGYVTLTIEVRGFGYLQKMGEAGQEMDGGAEVGLSLVNGRSLPGETVADALAGLNYLQTRKEADGRRVGVVGFSSGGKAAIYLAALDPRVKVLVASGCVESLEANFRYSQHGADEAVPQLAKWLDISDCLALAAPRPVLAHWGEKDNDRKTRCAAWNDSSLPTWEAARRAYAAASAVDDLEKFVTPGLGHEFDVAAARTFLQKRLPINAGK